MLIMLVYVGIIVLSLCKIFIVRYWEVMGIFFLEVVISVIFGIIEYEFSKF